MTPPNGHSGPGKGSQHIALDVPRLDPTSIHADSPVWSRQACLWHNRAIYGLFEPFWDPTAGSTVKKIHKIRMGDCSTITYKTKKNNKTVREAKLRKCLNSKVTGLISTL